MSESELDALENEDAINLAAQVIDSAFDKRSPKPGSASVQSRETERAGATGGARIRDNAARID